MATGAPDWWIQGIIPLRYLNLSDTPGDYIGRAGLVPEVNVAEDALSWSDTAIDDHKARHKSGGADEIDVTGLTPKLHETTHRTGGTDVLLHANLNPQTSDHHVKFTAAEARAAIDDIFGADGKADKDIDLDGNFLKSNHCRLGELAGSVNNTYITQNIYYDAGWKYVADGFGVVLLLSDTTGVTSIYTSPSGLADGAATLTLRFQLDVGGNLTQVTTYNGIDLAAPVFVSHAQFHPARDTQDWVISEDTLTNRASFDAQDYYAGITLLNGLTINELKLFGYRNDNVATMTVYLERDDGGATSSNMATTNAGWLDGWNSGVSTTIANPIVDNANYSYYLRMRLNPNDSINDVRFTGARISFA